MFNFFKKKSNSDQVDFKKPDFEVELTAAVLAYEIARSDGDISKDELTVLMEQIKEVATKVAKNENEILEIVEKYSKDSVSFHEFVEGINESYSKEKKLSLLKFMWKTAYADGRLDVDEERLIRRLADLIRIKDIEVLKLKNLTKK
tara:strand:- start:792 stop:1229 length:438 start_codon:yes stop_codon:yes gene_type:complete